MKSWEEIQQILDNLPIPTKKPCVECPWLRLSRPGHLGPHSPEFWIDLVHKDGPIACHMTITKGDDQDWSELRQCGGSAIYRANVYKTPRHPNVAVGERDEDKVFSWDDEFLDHHRKAD